MDSITALNKILKNLQKKYDHLNQIMNYTRDLEATIKRRDEDSLGLVLEMRQQCMNLIDVIDEENHELLSRLPSPYKERIGEVFKPSGQPIRLENPLETNIFDTSKRNNALLQRIVQLDETVNKMINKK